MYIADRNNYRVRKVVNGIINTVAGSGVNGYSGDGGAPTSATFEYTWAVALDSAANVYIVDSGNSCVRKVVIGPTSTPTNAPSTLYPSLSPHSVNIITTYVGTGSASFSGDGGASTSATVYSPVGIALDSLGIPAYCIDYNVSLHLFFSP